MEEITLNQFAKEIEEISAREGVFNVESVDGGSVYFSMCGCTVAVNNDDDDDELAIFKPYTQMEVCIAFDIIDAINKEDGEYQIEFNNGVADVSLKEVKK